MAIGQVDDTGRVWDLADGEPLGGPLRGYDGWVTAVAIGQVEGRTMAVTGSPDGAVRVWYLTGTPTPDVGPMMWGRG